ncbi:hypothetical protein QMZ65_23185 [Pantoea sp. EABMAA-21]|nr:hypothetical protein [Pantoea sp. EA-12]MDI9223631.1 hypothetical protein [Pantoea sp. EA-12]MDI9225798.1 hypothetical protein [Serratia bockelmannii]MDI9280127.1 hypothetical protein [Pantoea sp. EABMAA-21]
MTSGHERAFVSDVAAMLGEMVIRCHLKGITVSDDNLKACLSSFDFTGDPHWRAVCRYALSILDNNWSDDENIMDPAGERR